MNYFSEYKRIQAVNRVNVGIPYNRNNPSDTLLYNIKASCAAPSNTTALWIISVNKKAMTLVKKLLNKDWNRSDPYWACRLEESMHQKVILFVTPKCRIFEKNVGISISAYNRILVVVAKLSIFGTAFFHDSPREFSF